jgi:hypothetical protein
MKILTMICSEVFEVPEHIIDQSSGKNKTRQAAESRMVICKILKDEGYILKRIASVLNYGVKEPDHTSVKHALKSFENLYETNKPFRERYYRAKTHFEARRHSELNYQWENIALLKNSAL